MEIHDFYEALREQSLCRSAHDFSERYLRKNRSYLSVLKARQKKPTIEVWMLLSISLSERAQSLSHSEHAFMREKSRRLYELHNDVTATILRECAVRNR